jgi:hypothetical protein
MSGWAKAAIAGGVIAALLAVALVAAIALGVVSVPHEPLTRVLVIGTAPDENGTAAAAFAYVHDATSGDVIVLDTLEPSSVSGTSANNAFEAFPFGGGRSVAVALSPQTRDPSMPWVVMPAETWTSLMDDAGGAMVEMPERFSSYRAGKLVLLEQGRQSLSGAEAAAVAGSAGVFTSASGAAAVLKGLGAAVSATVGDASVYGELVGQGRAQSSVPVSELSRLGQP